LRNILLARELVAMGCVQRGDFLLSGGQDASVYVDLRRVPSRFKTFVRLARAMLVVMKAIKTSCDYIADVPTAPSRLVGAIEILSGIPSLSPVLERKQTGLDLPILGLYEKTKRVLLIDDVATTGQSITFAARILRKEGLVVKDALVAVDRQQGAEKLLSSLEIRLHRVFTLSELLKLT